jgi:hypothetical protein
MNANSLSTKPFFNSNQPIQFDSIFALCRLFRLAPGAEDASPASMKLSTRLFFCCLSRYLIKEASQKGTKTSLFS